MVGSGISHWRGTPDSCYEPTSDAQLIRREG
jgi:hypothetical protein